MNREFALATSHGPLRGELTIPSSARGLAVLARIHDNPGADAALAAQLAAHRLAVLAMPLLGEQEMRFPDAAYNVPLLTQRLIDLLDLIRIDGDTGNLPLGLFTAGHGSPAAIRAAARRDAQVRALACHGGLTDQAGLESLRLLAAPLLMLVDEGDSPSLPPFRRAAEYISCSCQLIALPAGEEPGSHVARWFGEHLQGI